LAIKQLTAEETGFVQSVYANMLEGCTNSLDALMDILSDNTYQMRDEERIKAIDGIYADLEGKAAFTKRLTGAVWVLSAQRTAEENDIQSLQNLE
jgi:hypothetical protein